MRRRVTSCTPAGFAHCAAGALLGIIVPAWWKGLKWSAGCSHHATAIVLLPLLVFSVRGACCGLLSGFAFCCLLKASVLLLLGGALCFVAAAHHKSSLPSLLTPCSKLASMHSTTWMLKDIDKTKHKKKKKKMRVWTATGPCRILTPASDCHS